MASEASLPEGNALVVEAVVEKTCEESFEVDMLVEVLAEKAGNWARLQWSINYFSLQIFGLRALGIHTELACSFALVASIEF